MGARICDARRIRIALDPVALTRLGSPLYESDIQRLSWRLRGSSTRRSLGPGATSAHGGTNVSESLTAAAQNDVAA